MRIGLLSCVICLSVVGWTQAQSAHASIRKETNIAAEELSSALQALAKNYDFQVLYRTEMVRDLRTHGAAGALTADEALQAVLADTGLSYKYLDAGTVTITQAAVPMDTRVSADNQKEIGKPASHDFRVAQATPAGAVSVDAPATPVLEEVVVTAQKRAERLQDVPIPVTAINAQELTETNQYRLRDYYASVPGLNFSMDSRGGPSIAVRGVTTGAYVTPTTGVVIDDVPFGSANVASAFSPVPEVDPNELARIEVLRGPQGALYGASSIGGLIKYVTVDPSTDRVSGNVQAGAAGIRNGDGAGYNVSGSVNVPLSDTAAIRANAFTHHDPGYIDDVLTGQTGVNAERTEGARLAGLWRPADSFVMKLNAMVQQSRQDGSPQIETLAGLGDLQQSYLAGLGGYERKIQAYTANLSGKWADAELTSITGYGKSEAYGSFDLTHLIGGLTQALFQVGGVGWVEDNTTAKFSQELRLSMPLGLRVDWLFGGFYTHERTGADGGFVLFDPVTYQRGLQAELQQIRQTYQEFAAFTDFTFKITDQFQIQVGGRESHNKQTYGNTSSGPLVPVFFPGQTSPVVAPVAGSSDNSFTYLVTPQYRFSPDLMVYARLASGYRPGGPNDTQDASVPHTFAPDKTRNYEVGAKGEFLQRRLSLDMSVFYIDWSDIQLGLTNSQTGISYTGNGSRAKSEGVELATQVKPFAGTNIAAWVVWNEAILTENLPPGFPGIAAVGSVGDRLPYSSRVSAYLSAEQEFPLFGDTLGFAGATVSYVGDRFGEFNTMPARQIYPAYAKTDTRLGIRNDLWLATLFVTNLTDRRAYLDGGLSLAQPNDFHIIQPRTFGFNISRRF